MKKFLALLASLMMVLALAGCFLGNSTVKATVREEGTSVIIHITDVSENVSLLKVMECLQNEGKLTFEADASGMVTAINGRENASDWSACWMLYTSDAEMANTDWGTIEYDGKTIASAIVGAEALTVVVGEVYLWEYVTF